MSFLEEIVTIQRLQFVKYQIYRITNKYSYSLSSCNKILIKLYYSKFLIAFPERKNMTEKNETKKTQWHPAFCSAMKLELATNKKDLEYISEHELNSKPIRIDLLVIEKAEGIIIENEIGKIFKKYNIVEYKSPDDELNVDTYFKVLAYACLYKAQAKTVNGIDVDDITISIVRQRKPIGIFKWFRKQGCEIEQTYKGIYYIKHKFFFDTQILVLKELNQDMHLWLTSLNKNMKKPAAEKLLTTINGLSEKDEREYADSVLEVSMKVNKKIFLGLKEAPYMCEQLAKLMEPELNEAKRIARTEGEAKGRAEGEAKGRAEGEAKSIVEMGYEFGLSDEDILERLQKKLQISLEMAQEYLEKFRTKPL